MDKIAEIAERTVSLGAKYPYDAPDAWWNSSGDNPPQATDWAHAAARGVLADLTDRRGIKHGFSDLDEDIRAEIVGSIAAIIRAAKHLNGE